MSSRLIIFFSSILQLWAVPLSALPWEGVLPQGNIPEAESVIPIKKDSYVPKSCFDDFGSSPYEKVFLDEGNNKIYYLDQGPPVDQLMDKFLPFDVKKSEESNKEIKPPVFQFRRSILYEFQYKLWKAKRLAYVELPDAHQIFVLGRPVNTLYAMSYTAGESCGRGPGALFGLNFMIPLHERDIRFRLGDYTSHRFDKGGLIFDNQLSQFFELAAGRFQLRRAFFPTPKEEIPLYASVGNNLVETWQMGEGTAASPRGVKIYRKGSVVEAKVRFKAGDKIIREGSKSAVLSVDHKNNQMTIMEIKRLTRVSEPISHTFRLPDPFKVADVSLALSFSTKTALVMGNTDIVQRQWRKVMLIDFRSSMILTQFEPRDGFDIQTAFFDPKGLTAFVIERDKGRNLASRIHSFDIKTKRWRMLDLATAATAH